MPKGVNVHWTLSREQMSYNQFLELYAIIYGSRIQIWREGSFSFQFLKFLSVLSTRRKKMGQMKYRCSIKRRIAPAADSLWTWTKLWGSTAYMGYGLAGQEAVLVLDILLTQHAKRFRLEAGSTDRHAILNPLWPDKLSVLHGNPVPDVKASASNGPWENLRNYGCSREPCAYRCLPWLHDPLQQLPGLLAWPGHHLHHHPCRPTHDLNFWLVLNSNPRCTSWLLASSPWLSSPLPSWPSCSPHPGNLSCWSMSPSELTLWSNHEASHKSQHVSIDSWESSIVINTLWY